MSGAVLEARASLSLDTYVVDCAWSADSRSLAVAGGEGAVLQIANAAQSPQVHELGEHGMGVLAVAWQPGRSVIASSGQDGAVVLWDTDRAVEPKRLRRTTAWTERLAFNAEGKLLAASTGKNVSFWNGEGELLGWCRARSLLQPERQGARRGHAGWLGALLVSRHGR
jgi:WD40 repeat protein